MKQLDLGKQLETVRGMPPLMDNGRPTTIGDVILKAIPYESANHQQAVRLWRIAFEIDKAGGGVIELEDADYDLLKSVMLRGDRATVVMANLDLAFNA